MEPWVVLGFTLEAAAPEMLGTLVQGCEGLLSQWRPLYKQSEFRAMGRVIAC